VSWTLHDVPCVRDDAVAHLPTDGSDIVVFNDATRRTYRFSGSAKSVWAAIDGVRTVGELCDVVSSWHGVDVGDVSGDVIAMLARLDDDGIIAHGTPRT
jgi:hypothetical protein